MRGVSGIAFLIILVTAFSGGEKLTPYAFPELKHFSSLPQSPANPVTVEGVELGRFLFYDPILSRDNSLSCSSCHKQESAFADGGIQFSTGKAGKLLKRNTLPLFNLAYYQGFFWDGRAVSIEDQVFHPVRDSTEMNLDWKTAAKKLRGSSFYREKFKKVFGSYKIDSQMVSKAIGQFLRSMLSYRSKYDEVLNMKKIFTKDEYKGFLIANDQSMGDCLHCHPTDDSPLGTTGKFSNNGLDDIKDPLRYPDKGRGGISGDVKEMGVFKIPSLRNLGFTAPYMHDGRFGTLEEVIDFYSTGVHVSANLDPKMGSAFKGGVKLDSIQKRQLIAFLMTLNDSAFIQDEQFGNPFRK